MNEKIFAITLIWVLCSLSACQISSENMENDSSALPNIIILFCDDLGYGDLGVTGHPTIRTPNLDQMALAGLRLTNFYAASPACTASRYALLTGKYPGRSGFDWVLYPKSERGIHPNEVTLAESLKEAGYATACYGKWHLGSTKTEYLPLQNGFDEYLGLPYSNDMRPPKWSDIPLLEGNDTLELNPDQGELTRLYTEKSIQFIEKNKDHPFFIYLPYAMPHVPIYASENFSGRSKRGLYGDVVEEIDWSVGEIIKTLERQGISENTLVFFTSDNGPWIIKDLEGGSSGLFKDGKGSTWEGGVRVPAIAYWPGTVPAAAVNTTPLNAVDLFASFHDMAGLPLPADHFMDGKTFKSIFLNDDPVLEERSLFFYGLSNQLMAVRRGPWKLHIKTYSQTGVDYFDGELPLLFNLDVDPSETQNVAAQHPVLVGELQKAIEEHLKDLEQHPSFFDQE